jgi:hypothetical protein
MVELVASLAVKALMVRMATQVRLVVTETEDSVVTAATEATEAEVEEGLVVPED